MTAEVVGNKGVSKYVNDPEYHIVKCALASPDENIQGTDIVDVNVPFFYIVAKSEVEIQNEMGRQIHRLLTRE